ncbi:hypothetical protein [Roseobacter litoralis]|uniref:hypothetical protein n=1 Tax=Roseobacter litoralis TaxID=42443 RepID=UPI0024934069|nr:hypothetical protein [Roseobacter litoralis]
MSTTVFNKNALGAPGLTGGGTGAFILAAPHALFISCGVTFGGYSSFAPATAVIKK